MFKSMAFDLSEILKLFGQKRVVELRGLSNRLIREASMENNVPKAELGVIAYALHKIETKEHFVNDKKWFEIRGKIVSVLEESIIASKREDKAVILKNLKKIISSIDMIDSKLGNYAQSIYEKSKVKQASLAYSYGLSIAQAAELTGADKKELQSYIGFTTMPDEEKELKSISLRVSELKKLLGESRGK